MSNVKCQMSKQSGQLLLEILIVISVVAIIAGLASQMVVVSMQATKIASERNVALGLAEETFEAVRNVGAERWQNIYSLTKGAGNHYYPQQSNGKWVLATGEETININNLDYIRYFTIQNICRDNTTGNITDITDSDGSATTCISSEWWHDPSTQKVTVIINWNDNMDSITNIEYITRWRNKICLQTSWVGGKTSPEDPTPLSVCTTPINTYYNDDGNIDNTFDILRLLSL